MILGQTSVWNLLKLHGDFSTDLHFSWQFSTFPFCNWSCRCHLVPHRGTPPAMRGGIALQMQVPNRAKGLGIRLPALWGINRDHSFQMFSRFKRVPIGIFCPSLFPFSGCAGGDVEEIIGRQVLLTGLVHAPYLGMKHWWWWSCLFYRLLLYEFQSFFPLVFPLFFFFSPAVLHPFFVT